jgi:ribonuclease P protein component
MREGTRVRAGRVVLYVVPRHQGVRAGFVSARQVGNAVTRNRARRQMREAWRVLVAGAQTGFDVVFAARPEIRGTKTQDLTEDMRRALIEAGVVAP